MRENSREFRLTSRPPTPNDDSLMTLQEVAEYLRLSEDVIYPLARSGELPGFKIGKQWRFRRSEIDAWLESKRLDDSSNRPN